MNRIQKLKCRTQKIKFRIEKIKVRIQKIKIRIQKDKFRIQNLRSNTSELMMFPIIKKILATIKAMGSTVFFIINLV